MIATDLPVVVVGLGFGDEAKGATVDFLCASSLSKDSSLRKVGEVS